MKKNTRKKKSKHKGPRRPATITTVRELAAASGRGDRWNLTPQRRQFVPIEEKRPVGKKKTA